jgi:DNA-binding GntR family transcriptional regulator
MANRDKTRLATRPGRDAPIAPRPLPVQIADYLRERIFHDLLKPGERIREQTVADSLSVSRTPLRDALRILETEGLVKIHPNRGATVVALDDQAASDARQVQATLEALAGSILAADAPDDAATVLGRHVERLRKAAARSDRNQWFRAGEEFYDEIVRLAGNQTIIDLHHKISTIVYRSRFIASATADRAFDTAAYDGIFQSIRNALPRDAKKAIVAARI